MLGFLTRLVGGAFAPLVDQVSAASTRLLRKLVLFLVAATCMVVVLVALTIAFSLWISSLYSPIVASLVVAAIFLLVAVAAVLLALRSGQKKPDEAAAAPTKATDTAKSNPGLDAQIDQFAAPLLAILDQFGLRRERLAVLAGASVAKQLGPLPLVGLAVVAGFLIGRMWKSWRTLLSSDVIASLLSSGLFGLGPKQAENEQPEET